MLIPLSIVYVAERVPRFAHENSPYTAKDVPDIRSQHAKYHAKQKKTDQKIERWLYFLLLCFNAYYFEKEGQMEYVLG